MGRWGVGRGAQLLVEQCGCAGGAPGRRRRLRGPCPESAADGCGRAAHLVAQSQQLHVVVLHLGAPALHGGEAIGHVLAGILIDRGLLLDDRRVQEVAHAGSGAADGVKQWVEPSAACARAGESRRKGGQGSAGQNKERGGCSSSWMRRSEQRVPQRRVLVDRLCTGARMTGEAARMRARVCHHAPAPALNLRRRAATGTEFGFVPVWVGWAGWRSFLRGVAETTDTQRHGCSELSVKFGEVFGNSLVRLLFRKAQPQTRNIALPCLRTHAAAPTAPSSPRSARPTV